MTADSTATPSKPGTAAKIRLPARETVGDVLDRLFPDGTRPAPGPATQAGDDPSLDEVAPDWTEIPLLPQDVFAAAGYLLEASGAYHRIVPCGGDPAASALWSAPTLILDRDEVDIWIGFGRQWRVGPIPEATPSDEKLKAIKDLWSGLVDHWLWPVVGDGRTVPKWWRYAFALLVVADEACVNLGYDNAAIPPSPGATPETAWWIEAFMRSQVAFHPDNFQNATSRIGANPYHLHYKSRNPTICVAASRDVVCVLPKSRTPQVGCTMRTLSHNLALLPPVGVAKAFWQREPRTLQHDGEPLNILLVPFPYAVSPYCFRATRGTGAPPDDLCPGWDGRPWGWFEVEQRWLASQGEAIRPPGSLDGDERIVRANDVKQIVDFVEALIKAAKADTPVVHGVVLPEISVNCEVYDHLAERLRRNHPSVEFLIAGSVDDFEGQPGNHVLSTVFISAEADPPAEGAGQRLAVTTWRAKHHRWCLEGEQVRDYGLSGVLDPHTRWWERTSLADRIVNLTVFRRSSVFTAMVCEDLARSDPCHGILKAIGANLVFVLLMDGTQLKDRWASRYATVLADDPGSSVLTLTSRALIRRANEAGRYPASHNVALWKDDSGIARPIECGPDAQAVVLNLSGQRAEERTLDGRSNRDAWSWRYNDHRQIRLDPALLRERYAWIVEGPRMA